MSREVDCFIIALMVSICCQYANAGCSLNVQRDLSSKAPVFVNKNHTLISPLGPNLQFKDGEQVQVICSGNKNQLTSTSTRSTILECGRNGLTENGKNPKILKCSQENIAEVIESRKSCIRGGTLKYIGFKSHTGEFVKYLEICYNMNTATVVYSHHKIPGKGIDYRQEKNSRPYFSTVGSPNKAQLGKVYLRKSQNSTFTKVIGAKQVSKYFNETSYLSRGHLSPDADGVLKSWQLATYFYINVAPQWQSVNGENWVIVEKLSRRKAAKLNDDLEIYTGVSGVMSLPNENGEKVPLYLKYGSTFSNLVPVPRWYWKILKYKEEGIAFITMNDPFATDKHYICPDICSDFKWPNMGFKDFTKGFTYCCKISDLIRTLPDVPPEAYAPNVMKY